MAATHQPVAGVAMQAVGLGGKVQRRRADAHRAGFSGRNCVTIRRMVSCRKHRTGATVTGLAFGAANWPSPSGTSARLVSACLYICMRSA